MKKNNNRVQFDLTDNVYSKQIKIVNDNYKSDGVISVNGKKGEVVLNYIDQAEKGKPLGVVPLNEDGYIDNKFIHDVTPNLTFENGISEKDGVVRLGAYWDEDTQSYVGELGKEGLFFAGNPQGSVDDMYSMNLTKDTSLLFSRNIDLFASQSSSSGVATGRLMMRSSLYDGYHSILVGNHINQTGDSKGIKLETQHYDEDLNPVIKKITLSQYGISVHDEVGVGMTYDANYSYKGLLNDRWIPDIGGVREYAIENIGLAVVNAEEFGSGTVLRKALTSTVSGSFGAGVSYKGGAVNFGSTRYKGYSMGGFSFKIGYDTVASGDYAAVFGKESEARGDFSTAFGMSSVSSGNFATSFGERNISNEWGSLTIGRFSLGGEDQKDWVDGSPIFKVGNGVGTSNRSNSYVIYNDGRTKQDGIAEYSSKIHDRYTDRTLVDKEYVDISISEIPSYIPTLTEVLENDNYGKSALSIVGGKNYVNGREGLTLRTISGTSTIENGDGSSVRSGIHLSLDIASFWVGNGSTYMDENSLTIYAKEDLAEFTTRVKGKPAVNNSDFVTLKQLNDVADEIPTKASTLQEVTDEGNTTSNAISISGGSNINTNITGLILTSSLGGGSIYSYNQGIPGGYISFGNTTIIRALSGAEFRLASGMNTSSSFNTRVSGLDAEEEDEFVTKKQLDNIESLFGVIDELSEELKDKVERSGDTMTGTLQLSPGSISEPPAIIPSGNLTSIPQNGAIEYDGNNLYIVIQNERYPIIQQYIHTFETNGINLFIYEDDLVGEEVSQEIQVVNSLNLSSINSIEFSFELLLTKLSNERFGERKIKIQSSLSGGEYHDLVEIEFDDSINQTNTGALPISDKVSIYKANSGLTSIYWKGCHYDTFTSYRESSTFGTKDLINLRSPNVSVEDWESGVDISIRLVVSGVIKSSPDATSQIITGRFKSRIKRID